MAEFTLRGWPAADIADPYPVYRHYREADAVHLTPAFDREPDTYYVFRYQEVADVLTGQHFGRRAGGPPPQQHDVLRRMVEDWLVFMDPPRHTELRSLIGKEFSPSVVALLRERVQDIAARLIAGLPDDDVVDLVANFAAPLPILVISDLLGVPREHQSWLRGRALELQEASTARAGRPAVAQRAARALSDFFLVQLRHRRRRPGEDLISLLAAAQARGERISDHTIVATCVHLMTAGHETTTNLIGKSVLALSANPDVLDTLRSAPALLPAAVEELTRYDSPVQAVTRWAYQDERLGGHLVPAGSKVVALLGSANRDPRRFTDPDRLDIHRGAGRQLGYGLGIHYCLGAPLARAEAEIALGSLLAAFPRAEVLPGRVEYARDMVFHGPAQLMLRTGGRSRGSRRRRGGADVLRQLDP